MRCTVTPACVVMCRPGVPEQEQEQELGKGAGSSGATHRDVVTAGGAGDDKLPLFGTAALLETDSSRLQLLAAASSSAAAGGGSSSFWPEDTNVVTVSVADDATSAATKQGMQGSVTLITDAS